VKANAYCIVCSSFHVIKHTLKRNLAMYHGLKFYFDFSVVRPAVAVYDHSDANHSANNSGTIVGPFAGRVASNIPQGTFTADGRSTDLSDIDSWDINKDKAIPSIIYIESDMNAVRMCEKQLDFKTA
jgi:hypothetical protein